MELDTGALSENTVIEQTPNMIIASLDDEAVMMNPDAGIFIRINRSAADIWAMLDSPLTLSALLAMLLARFDVAPEACREQLTAWICEMRTLGVLTTRSPG